MATTMIRHRIVKDTIAVVITSFDGRAFTARFQVYAMLANGGTAFLIHSEPWSTEQGAIAKYDEYLANDFLYSIDEGEQYEFQG